jgi:hypothetical protein
MIYEAALYTFWLSAATLLVVPSLRYRRNVRDARFRDARLGLWPLLRWILPAIGVLGAVLVHVRARELLPLEGRIAFDAVFAWSAAAAVLAELIKNPSPEHTTAYRLLIRLPGHVFIAGALLCTLWLVLMAPLRGILQLAGAGALLEALRYADFVPVTIAVGSVLTSARHRAVELVHIALGKDGPDRTEPVKVQRTRARGATVPPDALRIVQITDPHLGPWQPVAKLRRHVERLLEHDPHLVMLTGDYLTQDTNELPDALAEAFSPLRALPGRCFACFGNHDHEAPSTVRAALARNGITLLVDAEAVAHTPVGPVQILGANFYRGELRAARLANLVAENPRRSGHPRLLLLHDPSGFAEIPPGEVDLTLSGHTHGGHVGVVGMGLHWTVVKRVGLPDQGLFAHGSNRLYVHRGTGHYGFPLRVGVRGEASVLLVDVAAARLREHEGSSQA